MPKTILQVYAATVCFVSVSCLAIAMGIIAYSVVAVINPAFTVHPMAIAPFEAPPMAMPPDMMDRSRMGGVASAVPPLSEGERANRKAAAIEAAIQNELVTARQSLLRWIIVAAISSLLFVIHWRVLRRESGNVA